LPGSRAAPDDGDELSERVPGQRLLLQGSAVFATEVPVGPGAFFGCQPPSRRACTDKS
jgi:hypothetical protein